MRANVAGLFLGAALVGLPAPTAAQVALDREGWWSSESMLGELGRTRPEVRRYEDPGYDDRSWDGRGGYDTDPRDRRWDDARNGDRRRPSDVRFRDRDRDRTYGADRGITVRSLPHRILRDFREASRFARDYAWYRVDWGRITLGRGHLYRYGSHLDQRDMRRLLGGNVVRRLERHARDVGARGRLSARIIDVGPFATVIQVRAGREPLAEMADLDRDRRVDVVRLIDRPWLWW